MRPVLACWLVASLLGCHTPVAEAPAQPARPVALPALPELPASSPGVKIASPAPTSPQDPIALDLRVLARTPSGERAVSSGETLRSGDQLALFARLSEPAYVYVGLAGPDGKGTLLADPQAGPLAAGVEHRFPPAGRWLRLDQAIGREDIFVYASRAPLTREQSLQLLRDDTARTRSAARPARPERKPDPAQRRAEDADAPPLLTADTRSIVLDESGAEIQADVGLTKAHVVVMHRR